MKSFTFDNVSFGYSKNKKVFDKLTCSFKNPKDDQGHIIALMGASGSGKTTFLKLLLGGLKPQSGTIGSNPGNPVISYLPQEAVLFDHLSPRGNARYFANITNYKNYFDNKLFELLVDSLAMKETLSQSKSVNELSGGQKQRLGLIRALSIKPDILLLDEPTTGLDSDVKLQFLHQLRTMVSKLKILAIYVTHHKLETEIIADEVAYLYNQSGDGINLLFQDNLLSFTKTPPVLEAAKVFSYPKPNILQCYVRDGVLIPTTDTNGDYFFININSENIQFSETVGYSFTIMSTNPIYTLIEIEGGQYLTIDTILCPKDNNYRMYLSGQVSKYSTEKIFTNTLNLKINKIQL